MPASAINASATKPAAVPPQSPSWQSESLTTPVEEERTDERSEAEKMSKSQREEAGLPRLTAYATADGYKMKLLQAFLKREHGVGVVRVFDDAVYAVSTAEYCLIRVESLHRHPGILSTAASWLRSEYESEELSCRKESR